MPRAREWIGEFFENRDYYVLVAVLLIVGGVWGFVSLLDEVREGETQHFDKRAIRYVGAHPGPRWLQEMGRDVTALGGFTVLTLVTLFVTIFLLLKRKYGAAGFLVAAIVGGMILSSTLKHFVDRQRPDLVEHRSYVYTTSFPSGHSMLSAVVYLTLGSLLARYTEDRRLRLYFIFVAVFLTGIVGVSRVYMAVHWPTDVLAGWTAGCAWAMLCWLIARVLQRRGAVDRDIETPEPAKQ